MKLTLPVIDGVISPGELGYIILALLGFFMCYRLGRSTAKVEAKQGGGDEVFRAYQEVLPALTQNSVVLLSPQEYQAKYGEDKPRLSMEIRGPEDVCRVRQAVDELLAQQLPGWSQVRCSTLTALSEAVTNVVKHTPGGRVLIYLGPRGPRFHVEDRGAGMDLSRLPSMVFVKGYTESGSLGAGYSIMLRYMKRIEICTSPKGTALVLWGDLKELRGQREQNWEEGDNASSCCVAAEAWHGGGQNHLWQ